MDWPKHPHYLESKEMRRERIFEELKQGYNNEQRHDRLKKEMLQLGTLMERCDFLVEFMKSWEFSPSFTVQINQADSELFRIEYVNEKCSPEDILCVDTLVDIASITKTVILAAYYWALKNKKYPVPNSDSKLCEIDPVLWKNKPLSNISLHQLITHTSNLQLLNRFEKEEITDFKVIREIFGNNENYTTSDKFHDYTDTNTILLILAIQKYIKTYSTNQIGVEPRFKDVMIDFISTFNLGFLTEFDGSKNIAPALSDSDDATKGLFFRDYKARAGLAGPAGILGSSQQLLSFTHQLFNSDFFEIANLVESFTNTDSKDGSRFNRLSWRRSNLINQPWMYKHGNTGIAILHNTHQYQKTIVINLNQTAHKPSTPTNIYNRNYQFKVYLYSLWQYVFTD